MEQKISITKKNTKLCKDAETGCYVQAFVMLLFDHVINVLLSLVSVGCLIPPIVFIFRASGEYIQLESSYGGIMGTQTCVTWHLI
jgi:hypothetical protein